jgi:nicotinate-nucleotide adenylyltransferase
MTPRIGILGGTFDPVHVGHLILAACAREQLRAERILLIPNFRSPLKSADPVAPFADRLAMLRLAIDSVEGFSASDLEGRRGGISFTIDTLRDLGGENPGANIHLILGQDSLSEFPLWKDYPAILQMAEIAVVERTGAPSPPNAIPHTRIHMPRIDISSTMIRQSIAARRAVDFLVPPSVAKYIRDRRLYQNS